MDSYKPLLTIIASTGGGAAAWALLDGVLGTLMLLLGVIGAALGLFYARRSHQTKMVSLELERQQRALEIERMRLEIERLRVGAGGDEVS